MPIERATALERPDKTALTAAHLAADGVAELLRFAREGAAYAAHPFSEVDPAAKLIEAVILTLGIEIAGSKAAAFAPFREQAGLLQMELRRFLVLGYE